MPTRHRTSFEKKCSDDYNERMRNPLCSLAEKPFQPHTRQMKSKSANSTQDPSSVNKSSVNKSSVNELNEFVPQIYTPNPLDLPELPETTDEPNEVNSFQLKNLQNIASRATKSIKPSIAELPNEAKMLAELVKTSSVWDKHSYSAAVKRMELNSPDYVIDPKLSNSEIIVVNKIGTNEAIIAMRGTNPHGKIQSGMYEGINEPVMWPHVLAPGGTETSLSQFKEMLDIGKRASQKYNITDITGYSLGGTKALRLSDELSKLGVKVNTTTFNPFLGDHAGNLQDKNITHKIYRTPEDIATTQKLLRGALPKQYIIETVPRVRKVQTDYQKLREFNEAKSLSALGIVQEHDLENFTQEGDRNVLHQEISENISKSAEITREKLNVSAPHEREAIVSQHEDYIKTQMELAEQPLKFKNTGLNKFARSGQLGNIGSGIVAGLVAGEALKKIEQPLGLDKIDNKYVKTGVEGAILGGMQETIQARFATKSFIPTGGNLITGGASTAIGALAGEAAKDTTDYALQKLGVDERTSDITSSAIGGGTGAYVSIKSAPYVNQAVKTAANTARTAVNALRGYESVAATAEGIELTALETAVETTAFETAAETTALLATEEAAVVGGELIAGEVIAEAAAASAVTGPVGMAIAVGIGALIAGGFALWNWWERDKVKAENDRGHMIGSAVLQMYQNYFSNNEINSEADIANIPSMYGILSQDDIGFFEYRHPGWFKKTHEHFEKEARDKLRVRRIVNDYNENPSVPLKYDDLKFLDDHNKNSFTNVAVNQYKSIQQRLFTKIKKDPYDVLPSMGDQYLINKNPQAKKYYDNILAVSEIFTDIEIRGLTQHTKDRLQELNNSPALQDYQNLTNNYYTKNYPEIGNYINKLNAEPTKTETPEATETEN